MRANPLRAHASLPVVPNELTGSVPGDKALGAARGRLRRQRRSPRLAPLDRSPCQGLVGCGGYCTKSPLRHAE